MGSGGYGRADATFADGDDPRRVRHPLLEPGQRIDRYVIRENLGAGSMGMVVRAHDPGLSRDVALKLVPVGLGRNSNRRLTRLRREAQALARLNHGNVVTVLDVGRDGDLLFVAMELVEGCDLRTWLEPGRPTREVLGKFAQAGRGLAAAHEAGIVHRDFKPENVMVGADGRVRVTDFGLAREFEHTYQIGLAPWPIKDGDPFAEGEFRFGGDPFSTDITRDGALVGTPRYMAPEQFAGANATPLSDQFSFCVALFEALTGRRPYSGQTVPELQASISHTRLQFEQSPVPRHIRQALRRGLSTRPEHRFATMDALINAVEGPSRLRWRAFIGSGVTISSLAILAVSWGDERAESCDQVADALGASWTPQTRADIQTRLAERSSAAGEQLYEQVLTRLDAYAEEWAAGRQSLCSPDADDFDASDRELSVNCFDERRRRFEALLGVLQGETQPTVWQAADAVDELPPLSSCTDSAWLRASVKPPEDPDLRLRALEVESQLGQARSLLRSGAVTEALDAARASLAAARVLDHPPLYVESLLVYGRSQSAAGHAKESSRALEEAYFGAIQAGDDGAAAEAAIALVRVNANALRDVEAARAWVDHARTALDRTTVAPRLRIELDAARCGLHEEEGKYELAFELCARAFAAAREVEDDRLMSVTLNGMAWIDSRLGRDQQAAERFAELEALVQKSSGPSHPDRASVMTNRATVLMKLGRFDEARRVYGEALQLWERVLGPDHVNVAMALARLAKVALVDGDAERARPLIDRAMAIHRRNGSDTWLIAEMTQLQGEASFTEREFATATELFRRVLAERERRLAPDHREMTSILIDLGVSLSIERQHHEALAVLERALEGVVAGAPSADPEPHGHVLLSLAEAHQRAGHPERALEYTALAQSTFELLFDDEHPALSDVGFVRALVLSDLGQLEDAWATMTGVASSRAERFGASHPKTVEAWVRLSDLDRARGDVVAAIDHAQRAVSGAETARAQGDSLAQARFALARALARGDAAERARAREFARMALAHSTNERDPDARDRRSEIERFLRRPY